MYDNATSRTINDGDAATAAVASPAPTAGMIVTGVDQAAIATCEPNLKAASTMSMRG